MAANEKQMPLTIRENAPRVKKVIGSDNSDSMGLTNALTKPIETAAKRAAGNVARLTPGTIKSTTNRLNAVTRVVTKYPIISISPGVNQQRIVLF